MQQKPNRKLRISHSQFSHFPTSLEHVNSTHPAQLPFENKTFIFSITAFSVAAKSQFQRSDTTHARLRHTTLYKYDFISDPRKSRWDIKVWCLIEPLFVVKYIYFFGTIIEIAPGLNGVSNWWNTWIFTKNLKHLCLGKNASIMLRNNWEGQIRLCCLIDPINYWK